MTTNSDTSKEADFIMVLSSEMISDIVQRYLNDEMFKQQVSVVDTKPTESGYAFGICFAVEQMKQVPILQFTPEFIAQRDNGMRDDKGQFTPKRKVAKEQK